MGSRRTVSGRGTECGTATGIGWPARIDGLFLERLREATSYEIVTQA